VELLHFKCKCVSKRDRPLVVCTVCTKIFHDECTGLKINDETDWPEIICQDCAPSLLGILDSVTFDEVSLKLVIKK
jgi:hypothetical protein